MANADSYGDIHHDPEAFRHDFQERHQKTDDLGGGIKAEELYKDDKETKENDVYYWFSLHDNNHDGHLDGHELRAAWMSSNPTKYTLPVADELVDKILLNDDLDNDGKISWEEYLTSQKAGK